MMTVKEQKAKELDELFQMETDLVEVIKADENYIAMRLLAEIRKIKEHFKTKENEQK